MLSSIAISVTGMSDGAREVFLSAAAEKTAARGISVGTGYPVSLVLDPSLRDDRYTVACDGAGARLSAGCDRALFAAFGRWMEECDFDGNGGFVPAKCQIDFTPAKPLRGMYFATHFYNFYHAAPLAEVYRVVTDLAFRGCNALLLWFDMHHFSSMDDKDAVLLSDRLHAIFAFAGKLGIPGSLLMLANEGFASSPVPLRAEWTAQNGYTSEPVGHYHVELCPSRPGGTEEILRERREMLSRFADLPIGSVVIWPYDQGGCTCSLCAPWGVGGYLRLLPSLTSLVKEFFPQAQIVLSTWYFDRFTNGEWDGFTEFLAQGMPEGCSYIMSRFEGGVLPDVLARHGIPEGAKFIEFPEISMSKCVPWGGFGASHLADEIEGANARSGHLYAGGYPYSEGIFEDLNKYICLTSAGVGRYESTRDAVRGYVKTEFCVTGDALDELARAVLFTEETLERTDEGDRFRIKDPARVEEIFSVFAKYDRLLPQRIAKGWKFRLFYLRALIDRELVKTDGYPARSEVCLDAMRQLCALYHADERTFFWVKPPIEPHEI